MKKFLKIMTAAAVLLCGLALTGCGLKEIVKETAESSYKKWYKYKSEKPINIPLVANAAADTDTADESTQTLKNAEIYFYFDPDAGLTVAVQSVTTQDVQMLQGLIQQRIDFVIGSTKQYTLEEFGKYKWAALWGSGKVEEASAPKIYTNPSECIVLGSDANQPTIQWKKFLANYLLNKLLEE